MRPRWGLRELGATPRGPGAGPRPFETGLVPREHLGGPVDGTGFVTLRPPLNDREDRLRRLPRRRTRRVDLEDEVQPTDRLLQDHVDRFGLDVLADLLRGPSPRLEPLAQDGRTAPQDDGQVHVHPVAVMAPQKRNLRRDAQAFPQRLDVDLVAAASRVPADNDALPSRNLVEVHDDVAAGREDLARGRLPGAWGPGHGDEHAATILRIVKVLAAYRSRLEAIGKPTPAKPVSEELPDHGPAEVHGQRQGQDENRVPGHEERDQARFQEIQSREGG